MTDTPVTGDGRLLTGSVAPVECAGVNTTKLTNTIIKTNDERFLFTINALSFDKLMSITWANNTQYCVPN